MEVEGFDPERWAELSLWRNGEPLELSLRRVAGSLRVVAEWPRSNPGHYRLRLEGPHRAEHTFSVAPAKLSEAAFRTLLEDLQGRLPTGIAMAVQRCGGLAGIELLPPQESVLADELLRLRRAVEGDADRAGLATILPAIGAAPHRNLRSRELWVRRGRVRRPHPTRLSHAVSRAGNLDFQQRPLRVLDTRVEHTFDLYENRIVRAFAGTVESRLRRLALSGRPDVTAEAERLRSKLRIARHQCRMLEEVGELSTVASHVTMVLNNRPEYRAALEGYLELHRRVAVQLDSHSLEAPLENLPHLYELWGTLEVISAVLQSGEDLGFRVTQENLFVRRAGEIHARVLPGGAAAVEMEHPSGVRLEIIPERTFGTTGSLRSHTFRQRPDVTVRISSGADDALLLFDSKYKLEGELIDPDGRAPRPKKVDIDKMHAYRDAIRDLAGCRVVRYAAILYPGPEVRFAGGIEALSAVPGAAEVLGARVEEVVRANLVKMLDEQTGLSEAEDVRR